jgi:uncharacterized membrane protein
MNKWMKRGLVFAAAMVVLRLFQSALINAFQAQSGLISVVLLVLFCIAAGAWGVLDGRADARAEPDPDRREDLAMTWLLAGLVAGVLSGAISSLISMFYSGLYTGGLINEVTTFAAFTALCVFLFAIVGVALGRWLIDRNAPDKPARDGDDERADTDVFAAVRAEERPTAVGESHAAQTQAAPTAVATAEREDKTEVIDTSKYQAPTQAARTEAAPTQAAPAGESEAPTEAFRLPNTGGEDKTEVIRTHDASAETKPHPKQD